eukprot:1172906-Prorocentrum_minimum.AAC.2
MPAATPRLAASPGGRFRGDCRVAACVRLAYVAPGDRSRGPQGGQGPQQGACCCGRHRRAGRGEVRSRGRGGGRRRGVNRGEGGVLHRGGRGGRKRALSEQRSPEETARRGGR